MISVIIAAFNAEKYIEQCLQSVLDQVYTDLDIIVIDDGSTDRTRSIANEYAEKDSRIRVFYQSNQGPAAARNVGLTRMKGEYWTVLDADDWIEPDCYECAYSLIAQHDVDMVIWGFQKFNQQGYYAPPPPDLRQGLYNSEDCKKLWLDIIYREGTRVNPYVHCRLIKSSLVRDRGLSFDPSIRRSEDYFLLCQIHYFCQKIYVCSERKSLHYRQIESSITHKYVNNYFVMVKKIYSGLKQFAIHVESFDRNIQDKIYKMYIYRTIMSIRNEILYQPNLIKKTQLLLLILSDETLNSILPLINFKLGTRLFGKKFIWLKICGRICSCLHINKWAQK